MNGKLRLIIGMQWGSEGKGAIAAVLAAREEPALAVRTGGPNAGHSIPIPGGVYPLRHVPAGVVCPKTHLALGPGALVLPEVLEKELQDLERLGLLRGRPLQIDPAAAVVTPEAKEEDARDVALRGSESTREGIGTTRALKARRLARRVGDDPEIRRLVEEGKVIVAPVRPAEWLRAGHEVHVESTQGYRLSLSYGDYPHVTSTDITVPQVLNDAGVTHALPLVALKVEGVARTFPIRIAGNSGPLPREISWEELARRTDGYVQPELTTVTRKVRRVAEWDRGLMTEAALDLRPDRVWITFADYLLPDLGRRVQAEAKALAAEFAEDPHAYVQALAQMAADMLEDESVLRRLRGVLTPMLSSLAVGGVRQFGVSFGAGVAAPMW